MQLLTNLHFTKDKKWTAAHRDLFIGQQSIFYIRINFCSDKAPGMAWNSMEIFIREGIL